MPYDLNERVEIVILMAKFNESYTLVRREIRKRNGKKIPSLDAVKSIYQKFKLACNVNDIIRPSRPSLDEDTVSEVKELFKETPTTSMTNAANNSASAI